MTPSRSKKTSATTSLPISIPATTSSTCLRSESPICKPCSTMPSPTAPLPSSRPTRERSRLRASIRPISRPAILYSATHLSIPQPIQPLQIPASRMHRPAIPQRTKPRLSTPSLRATALRVGPQRATPHRQMTARIRLPVMALVAHPVTRPRPAVTALVRVRTLLPTRRRVVMTAGSPRVSIPLLTLSWIRSWTRLPAKPSMAATARTALKAVPATTRSTAATAKTCSKAVPATIR